MKPTDRLAQLLAHSLLARAEAQRRADRGNGAAARDRAAARVRTKRACRLALARVGANDWREQELRAAAAYRAGTRSLARKMRRLRQLHGVQWQLDVLARAEVRDAL